MVVRSELGQGGWARGGAPSTLTAIGLVGAVLTVKVPVTVPQLEGAVPVPTGELIGLTGRTGAWGTGPGSTSGPPPATPLAPSPPPTPTLPVLTAV